MAILEAIAMAIALFRSCVSSGALGAIAGAASSLASDAYSFIKDVEWTSELAALIFDQF